STQAAGHKTLVPQLLEALAAANARDVLVVCGGVIPPQDYDMLRKAGVAGIYGPGTNIPHAAAGILGLIRRRRLAAKVGIRCPLPGATRTGSSSSPGSC